MKTSKTANLARRAIVLFTAVCMACILSFSAFAETTNQAVMNDTTGVIQVKVFYNSPDPAVAPQAVQSGSGFLINDSTVITCNRVVNMEPQNVSYWCEVLGVSSTDFLNRLTIGVSVLRDLTVTATIKQASAEVDFAILTLQSQLYDRTYLPIRSSATVKQTEAVYALGFPGEVEDVQIVNTYTSDDVTIINGQVNKLNNVGGVDYVQTNTRITNRDSGAPLVDENGYVIGICKGITTDGMDANYFYAIAIDQLTRALDSLGIEYTKAGDITPVVSPTPGPDLTPAPIPTIAPTVEPATDKAALSKLLTELQGSVEPKDYTEETAKTYTDALNRAQTVNDNTTSTQEQIDAAHQSLKEAHRALEPASKINVPFIALCGIALVLIVVIVIVVVFGIRKKKPDPINDYSYPPAPQGVPGPNSAAFDQVAPVAPPVYTPSAGSGETSVLNAGAGETSVLNAGAGDTTLLNQNFGSLTRSKTGERIPLNNANFTIGKERAKVCYCVSDNTSVSRTHATLRNRGGACYLVDMKATNGTFVNGTRLNPNQESVLHDGDKITLADEEFVYHTV